MTEETKQKSPERLEEILEHAKAFDDFGKADGECQNCGEKELYSFCVRDVAPSIHYVHHKAEYICGNCGNKYEADYGDKGLA